MKRLAAIAALALAIAGCGSSAARSGPLVHTGYALEGSATPADIARDGFYLRTIGIDGIVLTGPDTISSVSKDATALRLAAQPDKKAILLVSNYDDAIRDFNEDLANQALSSGANRARLVAKLAKAAGPFDGLQLDLESLAERDRSNLVTFTKQMRAALPKGKKLSMAFMASTDFGGYRERGYDLKGLEPSLDQAVLMAYDMHGPGFSGPGPIAPLSWVTKELGYFRSQIPPAKIDLGIAAYGYQWGAKPDTLTVPQAVKLAGDKARWDPKQGEWTASLASGATLWWSDARSIRLRTAIAKDVGLHGTAIWQIGAIGSLR